MFAFSAFAPVLCFYVPPRARFRALITDHPTWGNVMDYMMMHSWVGWVVGWVGSWVCGAEGWIGLGWIGLGWIGFGWMGSGAMRKSIFDVESYSFRMGYSYAEGWEFVAGGRDSCRRCR